MGVSPGRWQRRRGRRSRPLWLDVEASALAASAAVMAPALTDGGPQKPENLIPALPAGGFLSAAQAKQVCKTREVLAKFVVSANVQPSKIDEQCLPGVPKDLIDDVINKIGNGFNGLPDLIATAPQDDDEEQEAEEEARVGQAASSAAIMSDPSMGDPADSMCFLKTIMGPGEAEGEIANIAEEVIEGEQHGADVNYLTVNDKQIEDERASLAQIMGFAADMNLPQASDMTQNVDELLQALKSIESVDNIENIASENRLTGGCGSIAEAGSQPTSDGVAEMFPDGETFPLNLLNDVDVMGLCNDNMADGVMVDQSLHQSHQLPTQQHQQQMQLKDNELEQHQAQVKRRQHELERRLSFIVRRLRKLQSRIVGEHTAEEACHVLELAQKSAKKCLYQDLASLGPKAGNTRNYPELAVNIKSFLEKLQKSCTAQSNSIAVRQRNSCRYFGSGSRDNYASTATNRTPVFGVPQIKLDGEEIEKVTGPLATKLKILQDAYDSDCTASSSGGDSCDEMQIFNNPHQQPLSIAKRASWRWAQERASIASRWTWLQAQISDLEYKIRQHNEFQRQIRTTKGLVMFEADPTATTTSASTVNGYSGVLPGSTTGRGCNLDAVNSDQAQVAGAVNMGASRTRPFVRSLFRKRKLVQLEGLHEISKKAARSATLRCNCDGTLAPCAICTGRKEATVDTEIFELMSAQERIAMVDPGYHPVLSLPDEVTCSTHMDAIMRSTEWQQKIIRGNLRVVKVKDKDGNERRNRGSNNKVSDHRTKYQSRLKKSQGTLLSASKRSRGAGDRANNGINRRRAPKNQLQTSQQQSLPTVTQQLQQSSQQSSALDEEEEAGVLSSSSKYSSPVPSPLQPPTTGATTMATASAPPPPPEKITLKEKSTNSHSHSRMRQNSYDIDNIVIPYSVASSTRLEKLPYKEIPIPKWRVCNAPIPPDVKNGAVQKPVQDNETEDVSDEAIALRHERSEREENRRFMNFANLPYNSRVRHNRRADSRADSGANTPDPLSPHAIDFGGGETMSPITSPPATPSNIHDTNEPSQTDTHHRSGSLQNALRRRTMYQSTRQQKEEAPDTTNEKEHEQVLPYEPRTFPLTDEDYDKMLEAMPGGYLQPSSASVCSQEEDKVDEVELDYQESDSTESALCDAEGEDPNDPEWTVAEARETEKDRIRPTAKR